MIKSLRFQFRQQDYVLRFQAGFFLFCIFIISLCCVLGVWQLHRYHYKKNILQTYQQRLSTQPVAFSRLNLSDPQFTRIAVDGHYQNDLIMLVQNRPYQGRTGFEVLTPLKIAGEKKLLLIDRGWLAADTTRQLPTVDAVLTEQHITGDIKLQNEYQFILGKNIFTPEAKPLVMQKIDIAEISRVTHQEFFPFVLRLSPASANGYVRDWVIISVLPQRHMAYAVQWFVMAIALFVAYFCFCCERVRKINHAEQ